MPQNDKQLIISIKDPRKKDAALIQVYRECGPQVRQLAFKFDIAEDIAKDVLQESVIVLWQKVVDPNENFVLTSKISTYVMAICKRKFLKLKQREHRFKGATLSVELADLNDGVDEKEYAFILEKVVVQLEKLGEKCRDLILSFYQGVSMAELAIKHHYTTAANATHQKSRCMQRLRREVESNG